ncbi:glycosyltransferase [Pyramidobacter sp. SM-530-WT-4B]|uniref:Glycosyltransferase n=1 Tax=Pyramidobacter porci TaxID=2605789 RepID=A0A6L5YFG6_9BACT|nr:glycosyltransferase family 2 protein [Pyramidobacter porci]MST56362.1 glycosyltransferase [Pyramidobacter porci]
MEIIVAIPCYNEELTIRKVVLDFRKELPEARIVVMNNLSTDKTAFLAHEAGAEVTDVPRQGKGAVIRELFRSYEADVYVLVDGDDTYPAEAVRKLISAVVDEHMDMAVGDRLSNGTYYKENKRGFHDFGNNLVRWLVNFCFKSHLTDIMTGYRAFSRRFVKNMPLLYDGFQVETELTISALDRKFFIKEIPIAYRDRPAGSFSKLNTFRDGFRVLRTIVTTLRDYQPLLFFGSFALVLFLLGLAAGLPVLVEYARTAFVSHVPLAILSVALMIISGLTAVCGLILNTMVTHNRQNNELTIIQSNDRSR